MSKSRLIFLFLEVPWVASLNRKRLLGPISCGRLKVWNTISPDSVLMSEGTKQAVLLELTVPWVDRLRLLLSVWDSWRSMASSDNMPPRTSWKLLKVSRWLWIRSSDVRYTSLPGHKEGADQPGWVTW